MARIFPTTRRVVQQVVGGGSGGWADAVAVALELGVGDTLATPSDAAALHAEMTQADTLATPTEAVEFGLSGYADSLATPTDARDSLLTRWATSNTTSGTAPVNPTNAQGQANGTTATVKAGGIANGTSTLVLTIAAPMAEILSGATRTLRAYYSIAAGATDTFTATVSYRQVGNGSNTTAALPATGNFLASGTTVSLTNIDPSVSVTVTFTHAAVTPATGGQINVDAVGIETTGAL